MIFSNECNNLKKKKITTNTKAETMNKIAIRPLTILKCEPPTPPQKCKPKRESSP